MCGIIGITRNQGNIPIGQLIFDALSRLEYRGYDSVGIAVSNGEKIIVRKDKGAIRDVGVKLQFPELSGNTAIGHSRWATHGPPSKVNAHPHQSGKGDVVVVHNGIIENFIDMREELIDLGYKFSSQTDTELIPHFISHQINENGLTMVQALQKLVMEIRGTYAIVLFHVSEPQKIYALKKDNPLVLGVAQDITYCASDIPAFLPWTKEVVTIKDNELVILEPGKYEVYSITNLKKI